MFVRRSRRLDGASDRADRRGQALQQHSFDWGLLASIEDSPTAFPMIQRGGGVRPTATQDDTSRCPAYRGCERLRFIRPSFECVGLAKDLHSKEVPDVVSP